MSPVYSKAAHAFGLKHFRTVTLLGPKRTAGIEYEVANREPYSPSSLGRISRCCCETSRTLGAIVGGAVSCRSRRCAVSKYSEAKVTKARAALSGRYERNASISRHLERDPIPYALETDLPVGVGGFEPLLFKMRNSPRLSAQEAELALAHLGIASARAALLK
jgi:hypothetical protein